MIFLLDENKLERLIKDKNIDDLILFFVFSLSEVERSRCLKSLDFEDFWSLFEMTIIFDSKIPLLVAGTIYCVMIDHIEECHRRMNKADLFTNEILARIRANEPFGQELVRRMEK